MAITSNLERLSRQVMSGIHALSPKAQEKDVGELVSEFGKLVASPTGAADIEALRGQEPLLVAWLLDAAFTPSSSSDAVKQVVENVNANLKTTRWSELGIPASYEGLVREVCQIDEPSHKVLQQRPGPSGKLEWRACLAPKNFEPLLASENPLLRTGIFGRRDIPALVDRALAAMRVDRGVSVLRSALMGAHGAPELIHLAPHDLALLVDNACVRARGGALSDNSYYCGRLKLPDQDEPGNTYAMPWISYQQMRGVAYGIREGATAEDVIARVEQRLSERGVHRPRVHLIEHGGYNCIALPSDQARVLLAPIALGDPATAMSTGPIEYDVRAQDYHSENGVLGDQLGIVAYASPEVTQAYLKVWGFEKFCPLNNAETDAQGFVAYDQQKNTVAISFRGSETDADWEADAATTPVDGAPFGGGEVSQGTAEQFYSLLPQLEAALKTFPSDAHLMIAGHSLGGALAELCLAYLMNKGVRVDQVYTSEAPAIGTSDYCAINAKRVAERGTVYVRTENFGDVVPVERLLARHGDFGAVAYFDRLGRLGHKPNWVERILQGDGLFSKLAGGRLEAAHDAQLVLGLRRKARETGFSIR